MTLPLTLVLSVGLLGQAPPTPDSPEDDAATRLAYMKRSVAPLTLRTLEAGATPFRLQAEPIFRLNNAVSGVKDGAIFLWADELGRPEAAIQVFRVPSGNWHHEFTSLSTTPLTAEVGSVAAWRPARPGMEFQKIPDAPKPGMTPEQRLREMRELAQDFSARDHFESKDWNNLRLLAKPLVRYGKAGGRFEDGALFSFVLGTDPEVFLMIEARAGLEGLEWQYAFAPMTCYQVKGSWKGREVWSQPLRLPAEDPAGSFFGTVYSKGR